MSFANGSRLASISPAATTNTLAFTATVDTEITRVFCTNRTGSAITVRLYHVTEGATLADTDALIYDTSIAANSYVDLQAQAPGSGLHLEPGDTLYVRASAVSMNFNIYGVTANIAPGAV